MGRHGGMITNSTIYNLLVQVQQQITTLTGKVNQIMSSESAIEQAEAAISSEITALNTAEQALATYIQGLSADAVTAADISELQSLAGNLTSAVGAVQGLVPAAPPVTPPASS